MANGSHGDHPGSDILDHDRRVFSMQIDALVRQITEYVPRERLWDLFDWFSPPAARSSSPDFGPSSRNSRQRPERADGIRRSSMLGS